MKPLTAAAKALDKMDRKILRILQKNGRIAMTELAEKVGLSTTPCTERVRRMERDGIIEGYYARLNPHALGGSLLVFVEIKLEAKSGNIFDAFRREIMSHLVSGDFDYLIKARIPDMSMYRKLLGDILLQLPSAKESKSYVVMEEVKETLQLPLGD